MAGNVKEWASNATVDGRRYLLGGAWNEPAYMFTEPDAQSPAKREPNYGFRCMALEGGALDPGAARRAGGRRVRPDRRKLEPVSDEVFATFLAMGALHAGPLEATVDARDESPEHWIVETVSFTAAYGGERVPAYLLLPKNASPPFQAVLYEPPGSAAIQPSRDDLRQGVNLYLRHLLRSGRAVLYPVLKGTYDRRPAAARSRMSPRSGSPTSIARSTTSRAAPTSTRTGSLTSPSARSRGRTSRGPGSSGSRRWSWWPPDPVRPPATAPRRGQLRAARQDPGPHDQRAVRAAVPLETAIEPLFRLFGAPEADKKLLLYESGHVPQPTLLWIKEALDWLDRYLGPVVVQPRAQSSRAERREERNKRRLNREEPLEAVGVELH